MSPVNLQGQERKRQLLRTLHKYARVREYLRHDTAGYDMIMWQTAHESGLHIPHSFCTSICDHNIRAINLFVFIKHNRWEMNSSSGAR
jgi:hypothetical protein